MKRVLLTVLLILGAPPAFADKYAWCIATLQEREGSVLESTLTTKRYFSLIQHVPSATTALELEVDFAADVSARHGQVTADCNWKYDHAAADNARNASKRRMREAGDSVFDYTYWTWDGS